MCSSMLLKKVIDASSIGYCYNHIIYNQDNKAVDMVFLEVNDAFEKLSGLNAKDIIGKKLTDVNSIPKLYYFDFIEKYGEIALVGNNEKFEHSFVINNQYYRVKIVSPEVGNILMTFVDINEIEADLIENEQRLKIIINNMDDLIWLIDYNTLQTTYISPSVENILRYKVEEAFNLHVLDTLNYQAIREVLKILKNEISLPKIYNQFHNVNLHQYKKDGTKILMEYKFRLIRNPKGEPMEIIAIGRDITEKNKIQEQLKESERSKSVLLANLPGMAYRSLKDEDEWKMFYVSDGCYALTGFYPESLILNKDLTYSEIIHDDDRALVLQAWEQALTLRGKYKQEYRIITDTKEVKWVLEQGQAVDIDEGKIIALEGFIFDITDQKEKEEQIRYLSYHDSLTGLYNRIAFEETKKLYDKPEYMPLTVMMGDINGLKFLNDAIGHQEGDLLLVETAKIIKDCCSTAAIISRTGGDEFTMLFPNTTSKQAYDILRHIQDACNDYNSYTFNESYHINISLGYAVKESVDQSFDLILRQAEEYMYKRKLLDRNSSHSALLESIKTTMMAKSQETEEHCERMQKLARIVGKKLNLTPTEMDELELAIALHDIGKVGISDQILQKKGPLTEEEWMEMKKHPEIGYRIAMASTEFAPIAQYILCHHERWDGTGYPRRLKGEEIPLLARIISVVDAFDAMTTTRSYRKGLTQEQAIKEMIKGSGTQFDPLVVMVFLEIFSEVDEYKSH